MEKSPQPCFGIFTSTEVSAKLCFGFGPAKKSVNASDMQGATIQTEVNVSAPKSGIMGQDDGLRNRMCKAQHQSSEAGDQSPADRPLSGDKVLQTFRSPRIVRATSAAGENSEKIPFATSVLVRDGDVFQCFCVDLLPKSNTVH